MIDDTYSRETRLREIGARERQLVAKELLVNVSGRAN